MEWIECITRALQYIEAHLEDPGLSLPAVAQQVHFSHFYLQRTFSMMTGMTLAEYIRQRRLSLAGQELQSRGARVIDVALKYGYDTPESFQKAFRRFHGVTPSAVRKPGIQLRYRNPLHLQIALSGGTVMEYAIEALPELTVVGMERRFSYDDCLRQIPQYWDDYHAQGFDRKCPANLGVCLDNAECAEGRFSYLIAHFEQPDASVPDGFVRRTIPAATWAKFRSVGRLPQSLQQLNRRIFTEWLPSNPSYELADSLNIEAYAEGDMDSDDYACEIWIPVRQKPRT